MLRGRSMSQLWVNQAEVKVLWAGLEAVCYSDADAKHCAPHPGCRKLQEYTGLLTLGKVWMIGFSGFGALWSLELVPFKCRLFCHILSPFHIPSFTLGLGWTRCQIRHHIMHDQSLTSFRFGTWSLPWSDWQACGHRRHDVACLDLFGVPGSFGFEVSSQGLFPKVS